ncbi:phenylalanine--tRNA ligase subunit beta [bacterium]|nr:phenylalanine--tRNA ligase subunit beta [bacterium]
MKIGIRWLQDFVAVENAAQAVDVLNRVGLEVEGVTSIAAGVRGVVAARIVSVEPHPGADQLKVCVVDDGTKKRTVVCGAPNAAAGRIVPYAAPGARLPELAVETRAVRGVESAGMLLSKKELGVSHDHAGLWILPNDLAPGAELDESAIGDDIIEISVTANRPDCLSVLGVAREIAAALGVALSRPPVEIAPEFRASNAHRGIKIDCPERCARYAGLVVSGLRIAPSPLAAQLRLESAGVRSISNIVDVTNYVMLELGQPLHAFDERLLTAREIVVRVARPGETIRTLDGKERALVAEDLLICDGDKPVALAGVMGGEDTEIGDDSTAVFIESARFDPVGVRRTSKRLGLASESSYRFERGVDPESVPVALARAGALMAAWGGGRAEDVALDAWPGKRDRAVVGIRPSRATHVIGVEIDAREIVDLLRPLELAADFTSADEVRVSIPGFRADLTREIDLIEEVARRVGFDNVPRTLPATHTGAATLTRTDIIIDAARDAMVGQGFSEAISLSMMNPAQLAPFVPGHGDQTAPALVRLRNPISLEMSAMRPMLAPSLVAAAAHNLARQISDVALFEVRTVFKWAGENERPREPLHAAGLLCGRRRPQKYPGPVEDVDFFDIKGACETLLESLGVAGVSYDAAGAPGWLQTGQAAMIRDGAGKRIGVLGRLAENALAPFDIAAALYVFEIDLSAIDPSLLPATRFAVWSRYPATTRDVAVVVDAAMPVGPMMEALRTAAPDVTASVELFDVYAGAGIPEGKKSFAFSITYQSLDGTLTDAEVAEKFEAGIATLAERFGAKLRS